MEGAGIELMSLEMIAAWAAVGTFIVGAVAVVISIVTLARSARKGREEIALSIQKGREEIITKITEDRAAVDLEIAGLRREIAELKGMMTSQTDAVRLEVGKEVEIIRRETGELGHAMRERIHDIEIFIRDHFVRRDSFNNVVGQFQESLTQMGKRLEESIRALAEKVDYLAPPTVRPPRQA